MNKRPSELLFKHLRRVWQYRRNLLRTSIIGLVAGLFISLSLPNEYEVAVFASAESTLASASDGLEGLPLEGIYAGKKIQDALLPSLYPQIVGSSAFLLPLFPIPVQPVSCPPDSTVTLYEYMDSHQRHPWWNILSSLFHKFDSQPVKDERIASDISSRITPDAGPASGLYLGRYRL